MRRLGSIIAVPALAALCGPACAAGALPESGAAKLSAVLVCRPLAALDLGAAGSNSSTECSGVVRNAASPALLDNLSIRCLEATSARPERYAYNGTCVQIDDDGDKLFMSYEGSKTGAIKWFGGTGKFKDVDGAGTLGVVVAPGGDAKQFAYTMTYDVNWTHKPH